MGTDQRHHRHQRRGRGAHQWASVDTSRSMPSRAYVAPWRLNGRCRLYLKNRTWASGLGPARHAHDWMRWGRRLRDRFAGPAGELLAHVLDHFPLARDELQRRGDVLTDLAQYPAPTGGAGRGQDRRHARAADARAPGGARRCVPLRISRTVFSSALRYALLACLIVAPLRGYDEPASSLTQSHSVRQVLTAYTGDEVTPCLALRATSLKATQEEVHSNRCYRNSSVSRPVLQNP